MKTKKLSYLFVILMSTLTLTFTSCKKDKEETTPEPAITLAQIETPVLLYKTDQTANFEVNIKSFGGGTVISQGLCVATYHLPTTDNEVFPINTENNKYFRFVSNLIPDKIYYVRAWVETEAGIGYSEEVSFRTSQPQDPTFGAQINGGGYALNSSNIFNADEENLYFFADLLEAGFHKSIYLVIPLEQPSEGTYLFEGSSSIEDNTSLYCGLYTYPNGGSNDTFYDITNGTMTITNEIDYFGHPYSKGTFSFTATYEQDVIEVTNGLFRIYY